MRIIKLFGVFLIFTLLLGCKKDEKSYCKIIPINADSSKIIWGNSRIKNEQILNNFLLNKNKLKIRWSNKRFIISQIGTGSAAWINLILPLENNSKIIETDELIAFDSKNDLIVRYNYNSDNYPIEIKNLFTKKIDSFKINLKKCESSNLTYCIDNVYFKNDSINLIWKTPYTFSKDKITTEKISFNLNHVLN
ncbi:MAG: hypothetical protein H7195_05460 [Chryseobacterium sp.]|nr:hypothetical protein [Chryseobacterium sp.]